MSQTNEYFDLLIIGAGLSGIGAGCHMKKECPGKSFAILEGRQAIGGTWDLFRYPGIRSDSDMYTLGYEFKPWVNKKGIADGDDIRNYIREAAQENKVEEHIRFGHKVIGADYSSSESLWTVTVEVDGETRTYRSQFLLSCTGYYNYNEGFTPDFEGRDDFKGQILHPQFWPEDLDYEGRRDEGQEVRHDLLEDDAEAADAGKLGDGPAHFARSVATEWAAEQRWCRGRWGN